MSDHHSCCCLNSYASTFPCNTSLLFSVTCPSRANPLREPARGLLCRRAVVLSARCWVRALSQGSCVHGAAGPARLCQAAWASKAQKPVGFATEPCNSTGKLPKLKRLDPAPSWLYFGGCGFSQEFTFVEDLACVTQGACKGISSLRCSPSRDFSRFSHGSLPEEREPSWC